MTIPQMAESAGLPASGSRLLFTQFSFQETP